jgi:hypothetical protein
MLFKPKYSVFVLILMTATLVAQQKAPQKVTRTKTAPAIAPAVRAALFTQFSTQPTAQGMKLREVVKNLTGGERPIFAQGFANSGLQNVVWGTFGGDGTINGILTENVTDTPASTTSWTTTRR